MITMLQDWKGSIEINGTAYDTIQAFTTLNKPIDGTFRIVLHPEVSTPVNERGNKVIEPTTNTEYRVTVKKYMTQPTETGSTFDFMAKWNNNIPMPLRTMIGTVNKETRGMVNMTLHGDVYAEKICTCMKCGRKLTNPVSQYFGIGPECGGHNYVNPFEDEHQLKEAVAEYRKQLQAMTWTGWIIKSAIIEQEEV